MKNRALNKGVFTLKRFKSRRINHEGHEELEGEKKKNTGYLKCLVNNNLHKTPRLFHQTC